MPWADYPFPLISTPAAACGSYKDQFVKSASKMAITHNVLIRGMNAIYLQCQHVALGDIPNFLVFCRCWSEMIHNHHECEEAAYFPLIEKACGLEGIADTNVDQHDVFMDGLRAFDHYVQTITPSKYSGRQLIEILDTFAASLQLHLTDEILWILSLNQFPELDLAAIDIEHANYVRSRSSKTRLLPFLLTQHDITYEDGIHAWWPNDSGLRVWFLRYVCTIWNRGAWQYSACSYGGRPQGLQNVTWKDLESVKIDTDIVTYGPELPDFSKTPPRPEEAHVRGSSRELDQDEHAMSISPTSLRPMM